MKLKLLFLMGCGQIAGFKAQCQQDAWESYTAAYQGGAGAVMLNMALKDQLPIKDLNYVMMVAVSYRKCESDGFPQEGELPNLLRISDTIKAVMKRTVKNKFVGTYMHRCQRQEFYYMRDTNAVRTAVAGACSKYFPGYVIDIKMKDDAAWKMYSDFLYPSEQMKDYMLNQKVVEHLQARGDALTAERPVEHWFYFPTEADREHFIAYAKAANFSIDEKKLSKESKLVYELKISRTEKVDIASISKTTWEIRQQAKQHHGEYDGWQAHVVK